MIFKREMIDYAWDKKVNSQPVSFTRDSIAEWGISAQRSKQCFLCKTQRDIELYPLIPTKIFSISDRDGNFRSQFCIHCLIRIVDFLIEQDEEQSKERAMCQLCAILNVPYSHKLLKSVLNETHSYEDGSTFNKKIPWVALYFKAIKDEPYFYSKPYFNKDDFSYENLSKEKNEEKKEEKVTSFEESMSEEDKRNRLQIISVFHRDVFKDDPPEEISSLQSDLVTMMDDSMADDFVRQGAAIEIVRTFHRIERISKSLQELQKTPELTANNAKIIKELVEQKKKETDMITGFSKDHGFAEKYALAKSKGSGTLGAIVRDMQEKGYDRGAINKFDIETAEAMKQVSDISAESIFKQIQLSDSDYAEMVKEQASIIRQQRETMEKQAEELRVLREKHLKQELVEEYRKDLVDKGLDEDEIDMLVNEQLNHRTKFDYNLGV